MPAAARKNMTDKVFSPHGTGKKCKFPTKQATMAGSSRVYVEGIGAVRQGDAMTVHPQPGCSPHSPSLDSGSSRVFVEGSGMARIGDTYGGEHPIISGSSRVFAS